MHISSALRGGSSLHGGNAGPQAAKGKGGAKGSSGSNPYVHYTEEQAYNALPANDRMMSQVPALVSDQKVID